MEERIKVGDELLVYSPNHLEKAKIIGRSKGIYILNNQMRLGRDMVPINSKLKIKKFDQLEWDYLRAKKAIPKQLEEIKNSFEALSIDNVIKISGKLSKLIKNCL